MRETMHQPTPTGSACLHARRSRTPDADIAAGDIRSNPHCRGPGDRASSPRNPRSQVMAEMTDASVRGRAPSDDGAARRTSRGRRRGPSPLRTEGRSAPARRASFRLHTPRTAGAADPVQRGKIICGLDRSTRASEVLGVAAELRDRLAAHLVLVYVARDPVVPGTSGVPGAADEMRTIEAERGHRLLAELSGAERLEAATDRRVAFGSPAAALEAVARRQGADLIVVGCRGRGALASALLGSVSSQLSRSAPCPVVVVPPQASPSREAAPLLNRDREDETDAE
jgi:nucleotide-binding universal stress UspA family protein